MLAGALQRYGQGPNTAAANPLYMWMPKKAPFPCLPVARVWILWILPLVRECRLVVFSPRLLERALPFSVPRVPLRAVARLENLRLQTHGYAACCWGGKMWQADIVLEHIMFIYRCVCPLAEFAFTLMMKFTERERESLPYVSLMNLCIRKTLRTKGVFWTMGVQLSHTLGSWILCRVDHGLPAKGGKS